MEEFLWPEKPGWHKSEDRDSQTDDYPIVCDTDPKLFE